MNKEIISDAQGICMITLFVVGSSSIFTQGLDAKQDLWAAFILGLLMTFPLLLICARMLYIFPNKNLFDIIEICFGKLLGKVLIALYVFHFYFISGDILVNYDQFFRVVSFIEIPRSVLALCIGILCIFGIKSGIEVLGRYSCLFVYVPFIMILVVILSLYDRIDINNFYPILSQGYKPVLKGAFSVFTFPFSQLAMFTMAFTNFKRKSSSYKIFIVGLLLGFIYLFTLSTTNILVIGVNKATSVYYPSYTTIAKPVFEDQRIHILLATAFIFGGIIKIGIFLLCACKGFSKLFEVKDYRFIVVPISFLVINLTYYQYPSIMYYFEFNTDAWPAYTFLFHVIFPILLWISCEIKNCKHKMRPSTN